MAKKARDANNIEALPSVKLYVASSCFPYKPRWSVQSPLIFFFGGAAEDPPYISKSGHICSRAKELLASLMRPEHDDIFIVDLSVIATPNEWRDELDKPGRASRMLSKWFMKFNPSASTIVVQGKDVGLIDAMIRSWRTPETSTVKTPVEKVVVSGKVPGKSAMESMAELAKVDVVKPTRSALAASLARRKGSGSRDPSKTCGVVKVFNDKGWGFIDHNGVDIFVHAKECVDGRPQVGDWLTFSLEDDPKRQGQKQAINVAACDSDDSSVGVNDLLFSSVEFSLDPVNKGLLQTPIDITAKVLLNTAPIALPNPQDAENDLATSEKTATHHLDFGMAVRNMIVQVVEVKDAGGMMNAVLSDAHGSVEALFSGMAQEEVTRGCIVAVDGRVVSLQGRIVLLVEQARPHPKLQRGYNSVRMGMRNVSERVHRYGVLVVRGNKCMLARSCSSTTVSAYIPVTEPKGYETRQQAATRAITEACNIYSEEFCLVNDVPPAVAYVPVDGNPVVLTIFAAFTTGEQSTGDGGGCGCDENIDDEKEELYDYFDFEQALVFVGTPAERTCMLTLTSALAGAVDAGIVVRSSAGDFAPKIHAIHGDLSFNHILALTAAELPKPKGMLLNAQSDSSPMQKIKIPKSDFAGMSLKEFEAQKKAKKLAKMATCEPCNSNSCGPGCGPGCC